MKKQISVPIYGNSLDLEGSVDYAIETLIREKAEALAKGFTDIQLNFEEEQWDTTRRYYLYGTREETDMEYRQRIQLEQQRKDFQELRERQEFERLKAKFAKEVENQC